MHPLLTFSAGLVAGIAAIRLLKNEKTQAAAAGSREKVRAGLDTAQERLRDAAIASLSAVEQSSARLRTRLTPAQEEQEPPQPEPPTAPVAPAARRAGSRKKSASKTPKAGGAES